MNTFLAEHFQTTASKGFSLRKTITKKEALQIAGQVDFLAGD